jgi:putative transposase
VAIPDRSFPNPIPTIKCNSNPSPNCQHDLPFGSYCLTSNHVHLIVIPRHSQSLAHALRQTHGRFAAYLNARRAASGHIWQGRYFSCPLDAAHFWAALRYTELNPVRAGIVTSPQAYRWSSAAVHCAPSRSDDLVDLNLWSQVWNPPAWRHYLGSEGSSADLETIRRNTHTGRPLGELGFVRNLEQQLHRPLSPRKGGRPPKVQRNDRQTMFTF